MQTPSKHSFSLKQQNSVFHFKEVTMKVIEKDLQKLSCKKGSLSLDIPTRIVKEGAVISEEYLCKSITQITSVSCCLKLTDPTDPIVA